MKFSTRVGLRVLSSLLLLALCSAPLFAAELRAPEPLNIETVRDFTVYQAAITDQLKTVIPTRKLPGKITGAH